MKKDFRATALVIRKKYLILIPLAILLAFMSRLSFTVSNSAFLFRSALLCMDNSAARTFSFKPIFSSSNIAFAEAPQLILASDPKEAATPPAASPPPQEEAEATVVSKAISIPSEGLQIKNHTSFEIDTAVLFSSVTDFLPVEMNSQNPQVLIFHTHTTESYETSDRTDDETKNVVAVGDVIENCLTERGINVLHCRTVHDYDYNGSYARSYETVEALLAENPSIKIVLDVHRDGIIYEDGSGLRVTADINGETAAQFMLVLGTNEGGLYHPDWQQNLSLGLKLQGSMNSKYPGLARPLDLRCERFNQNLSRGMMIVECGGNGNTLEEVKLGAKYFSDALFDVIAG